jgi:redox-sensitive bicupin YhaK (pirin superfamily)
MNIVLHKADDRGYADHGWLQARHSFSFAGYYDPSRIHFGVLRVLNDDTVAAGMGFGMHPHDNMEIITIPFSGTLAHRDSMGNEGTISYGEIQVMSAGSGIQHSEFNHSRHESVSLFQIWLFPNKKNVTPRYDQISYDKEKMNNEWLQIVSPNPHDEGSWIHQDAWFLLGKYSENTIAEYTIKKEGNGIYLMMIEGEAEINGQKMNTRDAVAITEVTHLIVNMLAPSFMLLMDIPMQMTT